jgi:hypothetical protein
LCSVKADEPANTTLLWHAQVETHRATQMRLEYMRQEEEYNARGKKKICQSCRKEQTFAEVYQRIKMCRMCQVTGGQLTLLPVC